MNTLEARVARIERRSRRRLALMAAGCVAAGAWLGAAGDPTDRHLMASSLVIVDASGRPVIDLSVGADGAGRFHLRDSGGVAEVVLSGGTGGGRLDVFAADGGRVARLGGSPSGDGMLLLSDATGEPLMRVGRWAIGEQPAVWKAPLSGPATP